MNLECFAFPKHFVMLNKCMRINKTPPDNTDWPSVHDPQPKCPLTADDIQKLGTYIRYDDTTLESSPARWCEAAVPLPSFHLRMATAKNTSCITKCQSLDWWHIEVPGLFIDLEQGRRCAPKHIRLLRSVYVQRVKTMKQWSRSMSMCSGWRTRIRWR